MIICGFIGLNHYYGRKSGELQTFEFNQENLDTLQDGLGISMSISKNWEDEEFHPDLPMGAQYDYVIRNEAESNFDNWTAVLTYSDDVYIDSAWNGAFSVDGNVVTFSAQAVDTVHIKTGQNGTFGAIMYSKDQISLEHVVISGYKGYIVSDMLANKILNGLLIMWIIGVISAQIMMYNDKRYQKQQIRDAKIIKQSMDMYIGFIDAKDAYTRGHSTRVAEYATEIARRMKLSKYNVDKLYYITLMHDCGKIGVPDAVLKKPGKLTDQEFDQIKTHTTVGDEILKNFTAINGIREGAHYHHERYDGKGYPSGLKGEKIPLFARIICVADAYDAMSSDRCYRKHLCEEEIITELKKNKGKQFDPELADIMVGMIQDGTANELKGKKAS